MRRLDLWLPLALLLLLLPSTLALAPSNNSKIHCNNKIHVCQNGPCKKRWKAQSSPIPQTLRDWGLNDYNNIEANGGSGCLGRCETGPNIQFNDGDIVGGIETPVQLATELQDRMDCAIPKLSIAAIQVLEKAQQATTDTEKLRFLDSVVAALDRENPSPAGHPLLARALVERAQVHLQAERIVLAMADALRVAESAAATADDTNSNLYRGRAWRCVADGHLRNREPQKAVQALQAYAECCPEFRTKIRNEMQDILLAASATPTTP